MLELSSPHPARPALEVKLGDVVMFRYSPSGKDSTVFGDLAPLSGDTDPMVEVMVEHWPRHCIGVMRVDVIYMVRRGDSACVCF